MKYIADLHIHSRFSRATSQGLNLPTLDLWAARKGIEVLGTGDATHPAWLNEIEENLIPAEPGFYRLKSAAAKDGKGVGVRGRTRFVLSAEVSCIYKKGGRVRKNHSVLLLPNIEIARRLNERLGRLGNITSDGRPILGLDARNLLELCLATSPDIFFIPAHVWTPWFSLFGSKSGFDAVEECFEDLSGHIHALETGLSSDPAMNARLSALDRYVLVSNSDAHSAAKLGREANLFETDFSYSGMIRAMSGLGGFEGTIEFFPEEGKYHLDGHRKCGTRLEPEETLRLKGLCPVCGKPVTLGVMYRVLELADRPAGTEAERARRFHSLIPLAEVLGEVLGVGPQSRQVEHIYDNLLAALGPELYVLKDAPLADVRQAGGELLSCGIERMRNGQVHVKGGYDGEFGRVTLFDPAEKASLTGQDGLFDLPTADRRTDRKRAADRPGPAEVQRSRKPSPSPSPGRGVLFPDDPLLDDLNPPQQEAVTHGAGPLSILAGPGTGKTLVLTRRAAWLVRERRAEAGCILGVTFTRQAAGEMSARLLSFLPFDRAGAGVPVLTFHALGARILAAQAGRERQILTEEEGLSAARELARGSSFSPRELLDRISLAKQHLLSPDKVDDLELGRLYAAYERRLAERDRLDFDDLVAKAALLLGAGGPLAEDWGHRFSYLLVDEFQDINLAQYDLTRLLMPGPKPSVSVIGDPDQAIYGFRGADAAYFQRFRQDYPSCREVRLTQNYRSTDTILEASAQVIRHNPSPGRARLVSGLAGPARLHTATARTPQEEAVYVSSQIERLLGGTSHYALDSGRAEADASSELSLGDIAILYRLHAQAEPLAEALSRAALPFQQAGDETLHETDGLDFKAEKINLLTMHAAKGLEFEVVFIVGVEEGLLPYEPPGGRPASLEEERRLFYVAMTRARQQLFLTRSLKRTLFGRRRTPGPSPFWEEISAQLREKAEIERKYRPKSDQMSLF